jgi:hypothetical protein
MTQKTMSNGRRISVVILLIALLALSLRFSTPVQAQPSGGLTLTVHVRFAPILAEERILHRLGAPFVDLDLAIRGRLPSGRLVVDAKAHKLPRCCHREDRQS